MRATEKSLPPAKRPASRLRRTTIERFIATVDLALPVSIEGWQQELQLLLTHPFLDEPLSGFVDRARLLARGRRASPDAEARAILDVATEALGHWTHKALLASSLEALIAYACAIAMQPQLLMRGCRLFSVACGGTAQQFPSPFGQNCWRSPAAGPRKQDVDTVVALSVRRAIVATLIENAEAKPFRSWTTDNREAALSALWLAYGVTRTGTHAETPLQAEALSEDLRRCGAPLWRRLLQYREPTPGKHDLAQRWSETQLSRLAVSVDASLPASARDDDRPSPSLASAPLETTPHLVVCRTPIPPSADKVDREEIDRHRILETPLPLAAMPSAMQLQTSRDALLAEFPWAAEVVTIVFDDLIGSANLGTSCLTMPATLFVVPPGSGKSRLSRRIAEVLGIARLDIGLGGSSDSKVLAGTSRGWAGGRPSDIASLLARRRTASVLLLLDELDKANNRTVNDGGILNYLLGLLEPETACRHYDAFLKTECDFSGVSWLCTANQLSPLTAPLRSRLRVLFIPQPSNEHFESIAENVLREREKRLAVPAGVLPELRQLGLQFTRLTSARQVRAAVEARLTDWSRQIVRH